MANKAIEQMKDYITVSEAAELLGFSRARVQQMLNEKRIIRTEEPKLRSIKKGEKAIMVRKDDVERVIREREPKA
jgi:excisionase family DNA binding protein